MSSSHIYFNYNFVIFFHVHAIKDVSWFKLSEKSFVRTKNHILAIKNVLILVILNRGLSLNQVQAYLYDGYWEDIGTIEAFYNANLGITKKPVPDFRLVPLTA